MYLKSIEVQGFKSFANKIRFDFHEGITGIVGPNGSGKSNVADAVRWVLGEQSAKQLRGSKMEDIIFAGTQTRNPVGFASVSITLDNSDHSLPVEYEEVVVSRRVFRSGESEYKINGNACRLKDISELFYDTGIGKEGYSIIGQGQIDKILSGKPEERRELFDEAAGIVKFKRRKAEAQKKLEHEQDNLTRVNDILSELENQVAPLEKQSEKARTYLQLKDSLKKYDVNAFLLQNDKVRSDLTQVETNMQIAAKDLENAKAENESTKAEYAAAEAELSAVDNEIELANTLLANTEKDKQRLEGTQRVYEEQIHTIVASQSHFEERTNSLQDSIAKREKQIAELQTQKQALSASMEEFKSRQSALESEQAAIQASLSELTELSRQSQASVLQLLEEETESKTRKQRSQTMLEQYQIQKAGLNSRVIQGKTQEQEQDTQIRQYQTALEETEKKLDVCNASILADQQRVEQLRAEISSLSQEIDRQQQQYHREKSRMESLVAITERYDGYGNSIRRVMEMRDKIPGIQGVIADIIKVEKKYETAIETALGGTIQNIVTDNEATAKKLIGFLKENRAGRATFLPLSSLTIRSTLEKDPCLKEPGVVGIASELVHVSMEYEKLARYLLARVLVVDTIDHALVIARKYHYSLRIVTLEGEQLNPGGSMTGGAFKNSSNLLGRRREIEDLKKEVSQISSQLNANKEKNTGLRKELSEVRSHADEEEKSLRALQLEKNTGEMNLKQAVSRKDEIVRSYTSSNTDMAELERQITAIRSDLQKEEQKLADLENSQTELKKQQADAEQEHTDQENTLSAQMEKIASLKLEFSSTLQKNAFADENIARMQAEIQTAQQEILEIQGKTASIQNDTRQKQDEIKEVRQTIQAAEEQLTACNSQIQELKAKREAIRESHKTFFDKREEINNRISDLDKEVFRLQTQKEKMDESLESLTDYMWNEYELTYNYALPLKDDNLGGLTAIKKELASLKAKIRALGDVNVNAIEEYKEVNTRYLFLKGQHDDLMQASDALQKIILDLDTGMRTQFSAKFEEIRVEFNEVFRELFGGGRGTIELAAGEDILEAGISIISQPPGKKLQNMMQLSGGERALTAISLLFAIQNLKPSPFCLLDEIEAALDDSNVSRYAGYLHKLTAHTQFIVITHRRGTMTAADRLYGITMQEKGVSTLVSVDLIEKDLEKQESQQNS